MNKRKLFILICATLSINSFIAPISIHTSQVLAAASAPVTTISKCTLYTNGTVDNTYTIKLKNASENASISYKSSNTNVATVNKKGVITAVSKGAAKITVTMKQNGKTYTSTITANVKTPFIYITNKISTLDLSDTYKFTAKAYGLTGSKYEWSVNDSSIATISKWGTLTPLKNGTVKIAVKDTVNNKYSSCILTITKPTQAVSEKVNTEVPKNSDGTYQSAVETGKNSITWSGTNTEAKGAVGIFKWIDGYGVQINGVTCSYPGITASYEGVIEDYGYAVTNATIKYSIPSGKDMTADEAVEWINNNYSKFKGKTSDFGVVMAIHAIEVKALSEGGVKFESAEIGNWISGVSSAYQQGAGSNPVKY